MAFAMLIHTYSQVLPAIFISLKLGSQITPKLANQSIGSKSPESPAEFQSHFDETLKHSSVLRPHEPQFLCRGNLPEEHSPLSVITIRGLRLGTDGFQLCMCSYRCIIYFKDNRNIISLTRVILNICEKTQSRKKEAKKRILGFICVFDTIYLGYVLRQVWSCPSGLFNL